VRGGGYDAGVTVMSRKVFTLCSAGKNPDVVEGMNHSVTIARFPDEALAHMAAGKLLNEGIPATVLDQVPLRAIGQREAVIAVPAADVDRAVVVLMNSPARVYLLTRASPQG
jgi:hypothetical protein